MSERHLYNGRFEFEGSMDDDGNIYDRNHWKIGHVEGGTIYDNCHIPRGHIDGDGRVTDMCNIPTGKEFGANFVGWDGHGSGLKALAMDLSKVGYGSTNFFFRGPFWDLRYWDEASRKRFVGVIHEMWNGKTRKG